MFIGVGGAMGEIFNQILQNTIALFLGMSSIEFVPNQIAIKEEAPLISAFELYDKKNSPIFVASINKKGKSPSFCLSKQAQTRKFKKISFSLPQQ
ncbi:MAG: hypothetical protein J0L55_16020 [Caulobacterales bacterium]|nr:hypothetical protein [Caulobacterales bacterium]